MTLCCLWSGQNQNQGVYVFCDQNIRQSVANRQHFLCLFHKYLLLFSGLHIVNKMSAKRRGVLSSRAREIIMSVNDYFENEKNECKHILSTLKLLLKNNADDSDILISKHLISDLTRHLKKQNKTTECVVRATGVHKATLFKVREEKAEAVATGNKMRTPRKKPRGNKLDNIELVALRNIIHSFYSVKKEVPTLKKIFAAAQRDFDYQGSESTLRRILVQDLGYCFKKMETRRALIERPEIQAWRAKYLSRMQQNDALHANKQNVVYIGEIWIHTNCSVATCGQSSSDVGVKRSDSAGQSLIIVHAGNEKGFVEDAQLVFDDQINTEIFSKWVEEKLLPNIKPYSIIVMDNASYHSKEQNKTPGISSSRQEMVHWLQLHKIEFPVSATKPELYMIIKQQKPPRDCFIDKLFLSHGHEVVRLPPYNCDLNPIEYVWTLLKQRIAGYNVDQFESNIEHSTLEVLKSITPEDWRNAVNHVKTLEKEYWDRDRLIDELFVTNTGEHSDSESWDSAGSSESE